MERDNGQCSILIPTWNRSDLLIRAVNSAIEQGDVVKEIIVIDNASDKESLWAIQEISSMSPKISIYQQSVNIGPSGNWLSGLRKIQTPWVKFLFSDDWLESSCVSEMIAIQVETNSDLIVSGSYGHIGGIEHLWYQEESFSGLEFNQIANKIADRLIPVSATSALMKTRDAICGLQDASASPKLYSSGIGSDLIMMFYPLAVGGKMTFTNKPLVHMYGDSTSISLQNVDLMAGYYAEAFLLLCKKYNLNLSHKLLFNQKARILRTRKASSKS